MSLEFVKLEIPEVILIKPKVFEDEQGFFMEAYKASLSAQAGINFPFVQYNHSKSKKGVLRGLHYQLEPKAQSELVRFLKGKIWDVAVDVRKGYPTFGKWVAVELSGKSKFMLWILPGFAHGFLALEDCEIIYKCTEEYAPKLDRGIIWNYPGLAIPWSIEKPTLSPKDEEINFEYGRE